MGDQLKTILKLIGIVCLVACFALVVSAKPLSLNEGVKIARLNPYDGHTEYFIIVNDNLCTYHLKNWKIKEYKNGISFTFPKVDIQSAGLLTVYTGSGKNTADKYYMGLKKHIFAKKDRVKLYNSCGILISDFWN